MCLRLASRIVPHLSDILTVIRTLKKLLLSCAFGLVKSVSDAVSLTLDFLSHYG